MKKSIICAISLLALSSGLSLAQGAFERTPVVASPKHVVVTPRRQITVVPHLPTVKPAPPTAVKRISPPAR